MVRNLEFFESDPQPGKNRGRGWYYYRGNLSTGLVGGAGTRNPRNQRGPTWSFYSRSATTGSRKDAKRAAFPTKVNDKTKAEKNAPHKGDYKTRPARSSSGRNPVRATKVKGQSRRKYVKNRKTTRAGEGISGFF